MRWLAAQLSSTLCRRQPVKWPARSFSSLSGKEDVALEEEADRKIGWFLKLLFAGTATIVAYNIFPYMGDSLVEQSVSLLNVKDPLFKRVGASRLARFCVDDGRRMKIVEMGGAEGLVKMLDSAKDDKTKNEALKALTALSGSDEAVTALYHAGIFSAIKSIPDSSDNKEVLYYKSCLVKRFRDLKYEL